MRRPVLIALLASVAGTACFLWSWTPALLSNRSPQMAAGAHPATGDRIGDTDAEPQQASRSETQQAAPSTSAFAYEGVPLPPADAPLDQTLNDLLTRARAGDMRAACRLSADLLRCRNARAATDTFAKLPYPVDARVSSEIRDVLKHALDASDRCRSVPSALIDQAPRWLRRAADAGSRDARVLFALGVGFDGGEQLFSLLHSQDFDYWRTHAPDLMRHALQQGSADAAEALAEGAQGDDSPFAALIPNDPVQGNAYRLLWLRLHPGSKGRMAVLTPAQDAQAAALADAMFRDDFGGETPPARDTILRAADLRADPIAGLCDGDAP